MKKLFLLSIPLLLSGCGNQQCPECEQCQQPETNNYEIVSIQPFYTDLLERCKDDTKIPFPSGVEHESDIIIEGGKNLAKSLDNVSYKNENILKDSIIGKDTFKLFGKNQIIQFQTHGEYIDEWTHSIMITGGDYIESKISKEDEERIVEAGMYNPNSEYHFSAITSEFVKAYCPDITGSIVYMGQCHGAHDYALATAFLDKGAIAVYGSSLQIQMHYGDMMQFRITSLLGEVNPNTNNYYTTGEALKKAQEEYGIDDTVLYQGGGMGARIILFGDYSFRLASK